MKWLKAHLAQFVVTICAGAIIFFLGVWYNNYQNEVQYLDYVIQKSESILKGAREVGDTIKFTVNGKQVRDISELDIQLINRSNTDLQDVPIIIELERSYQLNIISVNYYDQNNSKELIEPLSLGTSNNVRFGYMIKVLNRKIEEPVFSIKLLVEGESTPDFKVYVNKVGITVREYDKSNYQFLPKMNFANLFFSVAMITCASYIIFAFYSMIADLKRTREEIEKKSQTP